MQKARTERAFNWLDEGVYTRSPRLVFFMVALATYNGNSLFLAMASYRFQQVFSRPLQPESFLQHAPRRLW